MLDFSQDTLQELRGFVHHHREALQNASLLLGGQAWLRRTQSLIDDVTGSTVVTRRMSEELQALVDLLHWSMSMTLIVSRLPISRIWIPRRRMWRRSAFSLRR